MEIDSDVKDASIVLIKQGAEARVFESNFVGRRSIIKERFSKKYRHPSLDSKLTVKRLNAEARCMTKARRLGVYTPVLYAVDPLLHTLTFEYVDGPSVKDVFLEFGLHGVVEERLDDIATQIGDAIGKLHDGGLIHGDLTTSNMLIRSSTNQLVLIDFGLSFTSTLPEDKAVDLYVLERALLSMHSSCGNVMDRILAAYRKSSKQWSSTMNKLAQVNQNNADADCPRSPHSGGRYSNDTSWYRKQCNYGRSASDSNCSLGHNCAEKKIANRRKKMKMNLEKKSEIVRKIECGRSTL